MMPTPYIGFSSSTLSQQPSVKAGDPIACEICGNFHILEPADDGSEVLLFYNCDGESYLGAVGGKSIVGVRFDVSGET